MKDGVQVSIKHVVEASFDLGFPPFHIYNDDMALKDRISKQHNWIDSYDSILSGNSTTSDASIVSFFSLVRGSGVSTGTLPGRPILLEFTNGSPCDIVKNQNRSSTVEVSCGIRDAIIDITEDSTCHYYIKATSRVLCLSKLFAPRVRQVSQLGFSIPNDEHIVVKPATE